jgi:nucleoside-diphosphate-sugar epimerase
MRKHILITGGAGFIGSHPADELLRRSYRVRALDNLSPQVHGHGVSCAGRTADDHVTRANAELEEKGLAL